jgi:hyperpolarization activated cyclic nucleotide-gated potassium channel 2
MTTPASDEQQSRSLKQQKKDEGAEAKNKSGDSMARQTTHNTLSARLPRRLHLTHLTSGDYLRVRLFSAPSHEEEHAYVAMESFMIHPNSNFAAGWNVVVMICVIYSAIIVTFEICFSTSAGNLWQHLSRVVDVVFVIDLLVNFRLCYFDKLKLQQEKGAVAKRYLLSHWFVIDAVSTVGGLLEWFQSSSETGLLKNFKILRIARLLKLLRLVKVVQVVNTFENNSYDVPFLSKILKLGMYAFGSMHICACLFHLVGSSYASDEANWLAAYWGDPMSETFDPDEVPVGTRYVSALYWAMATGTTVGYGDVKAVTILEKLYSIFAMWVGSALFAMLVGEVTIIAQEMDRNRNHMARKMAEVEDFMKEAKLPNFLRLAIRFYYQVLCMDYSILCIDGRTYAH